MVYRFDAPLFFANVPYFARRVRELVRESRTPPRWFVLNAEAIPSLDATAIEGLGNLRQELHHQGIRLVIARANATVRAMRARSSLGPVTQADIFHSVHDAIEAYRRDDGRPPQSE